MFNDVASEFVLKKGMKYFMCILKVFYTFKRKIFNIPREPLLLHFTPVLDPAFSH